MGGMAIGAVPEMAACVACCHVGFWVLIWWVCWVVVRDVGVGERLGGGVIVYDGDGVLHARDCST